MSPQDTKGLRVAVEGCGHGTLDAIYTSAKAAATQRGWDGLDLLIIGGDFQANRNQSDLNIMACPPKYRSMADFHKYYSGQVTAPYLTIFIGGNHEASNHLFELYYGGWVAPNIYYLGTANIVRVGPLRVAGMSGIWHGAHYRKPHYERLPYNGSDERSIYHTREIDVRKMMQVRTQVDVGLSHDWPQGVEWMGNTRTLFTRKGYLLAEAEDGTLNNRAARWVCQHLRPAWWFSAHHHILYGAVLHHDTVASAKGDDGNAKSDGMGGTREASSSPYGKPTAKRPRQGIHEVHNNDEIHLDLDAKPTTADSNVVLQVDNSDEIKVDEAAYETLAEAINEEETNGAEAAEALAGAKAKLLASFLAADGESEQYCHIDNGQVDSPNSGRGQSLSTELYDSQMIYAPSSDQRYPPYRSRASPKTGSHAVEVSDNVRAQLPASFAPPPPVSDEPDAPTSIENATTNFLALGKYGQEKCFLRALELKPVDEFESIGPIHLEYDPEWLAINRVFASPDYLGLGDIHARVPADLGRAQYASLIDKELTWVQNNIVAAGKLRIPNNFERIAPEYDPSIGADALPREYPSPQTQAFCDLIGIENAFRMSEEEAEERWGRGPRQPTDDEKVRMEKSRGRGRSSGRGGFGRGGSSHGAPRRGGRGGFRARGRPHSTVH